MKHQPVHFEALVVIMNSNHNCMSSSRGIGIISSFYLSALFNILVDILV